MTVRINLSARKLSIWSDSGEHPYQCELPPHYQESDNWMMLAADRSMGIIERTTLGEVSCAIEHYSGQPIPPWLLEELQQQSHTNHLRH